jgi:UDP-N-acetylmuramate--alanine ligase
MKLSVLDSAADQQVHFVGIGGIGMSGIAKVMFSLGYRVSGSDIQENECVHKLRSLGIVVHFGHDAQWVQGAAYVVVSSAVSGDNVEVVAAKDQGIPVIPRAQMLAELMRLKHGIAVAGTHGKTTTTSMIAAIFAQAGLDPTYIVGGQITQMKEHAQLGLGDYLIAEADESDASFLHLQPKVAVITNIDHDHLGAYDNDVMLLEQAFLDFAHKVPFYGLVVLCGDDARLATFQQRLARPVWTYGFSEGNTFYATDYCVTQDGSTFMVHAPRLGINDWPCCMPVCGRHNVSNALAAIAVAWHCEVDKKVILQALGGFSGVGRRFQVAQINIGDKAALFVDDYGHHPTEMAAVIETVRENWPKRRLVMLFQPHRYSRTKDLFHEFVRVLARVDVVILLPIYEADETAISGVTHWALARAVEAATGRAVFCLDLDDVAAQLQLHVADGDVFLAQGAGNIGKIAQQLRQEGHVTVS